MKNDIIKGGRGLNSADVINRQSTDINKDSVEETQKRSVRTSGFSERLINDSDENSADLQSLTQPCDTVKISDGSGRIRLDDVQNTPSDISDRNVYHSGDDAEGEREIIRPAENTGSFYHTSVNVEESINGGGTEAYPTSSESPDYTYADYGYEDYSVPTFREETPDSVRNAINCKSIRGSIRSAENDCHKAAVRAVGDGTVLDKGSGLSDKVTEGNSKNKFKSFTDKQSKKSRIKNVQDKNVGKNDIPKAEYKGFESSVIDYGDSIKDEPGLADTVISPVKDFSACEGNIKKNLHEKAYVGKNDIPKAEYKGFESSVIDYGDSVKDEPGLADTVISSLRDFSVYEGNVKKNLREKTNAEKNDISSDERKDFKASEIETAEVQENTSEKHTDYSAMVNDDNKYADSVLETKETVNEEHGHSDMVKTKDDITDRTSGDSDTIKPNGKKSSKNKDRYSKKDGTGITSAVKEYATDTLISEMINSEDMGVQAAGIAAAATVQLNKAVKGKLRRNKAKRSDTKSIRKAYGIKEASKKVPTSVLSNKGSSADGIVGMGGGVASRVIRNKISEAGDDDMGFKAVDNVIKGVDTAKTVKNTTKAVINTGKRGVKTAVSAPKKAAKGMKKLKHNVEKARKMARMSAKAAKAAGRTAKAAGKAAMTTIKVTAAAIKAVVTAVVAAVQSLIAAAPVIGVCVVIVVIIAAIIAFIAAVSLKSEDSELTKTWEYITELDCKFSHEYMEKWAGFPFDAEGVCESMADDPDIRIKRVFKINGIQTGSGNIPYRSDIDAWLLYLDCKYEDYTLSEVKDEIDELYSEVNSLSFETDTYTESVGEGEDARALLIYELTINANIKNFRTYIDSNKDTLFTPSQREMYNAITEVGQYVTRADFANPFGEDTILFSSRRYGNDIIPENVYGEDGFYLGMTPSSYLSLLERHGIDLSAGDEFADLLNTYTIEMHKGLDLKAASGADVYAPIGGEITVSGNSVKIEGSKKRLTVRGISSTALSNGQIVRKGDKIGITGDDGYICLEYEVKDGLTYTNQNPAFYLGNVTYEITGSFSDADTPIDLSMYEISDELKGTARSVVEAALAMVGAGGYSGACAKVASTIYQNAGLGYHGGNGNDFSRANRLVVDGGHVDYTKIPVGAYIGIKYGTGSAGYLYGHVGIYVGVIGGVPYVVEGGGATVALTPLDHFYDYYVTSNPNSVYGNEIGWNITSTGGSVSPLYFEH